MVKIKITSLFFLLAIIFSSCSSQNQPKKLTVAAAASTQFAIKEMAEQFGKENNIVVDVIIGSSGKITTQIINGAPYDIFFSANMKYPQTLYEKKMTLEAPKNYGFGVPIFWTMDTTLILDEEGQFLLTNSIEKIAIANPKNAPYGEMALVFFKNNNIYDSVESRLVYGESISQVNEYILSKTALVGVSAKSIVLSPNVTEKGLFLSLDNKYWVEQGVVELANNKPSEERTAFMKYIFSPEGERILKKYGYEK